MPHPYRITPCPYYTDTGDFVAKTLHNPWRTDSGRSADFLTAVEGIMPASAAA